MRGVIGRSARGKHPDAARRLLVRQLEPATRLLPDVCPRAGTVERVLLAVTAGVRAPLLSLTARAADVSLRLPPSRWLLAGARPPPGPSPRSPAPADRLLRGAPGAGSVSFDPEAGVVTGLTRDRDSRSENRCSMCSAIHISSRTSLRPSSTREPSDPPPRVVLTFVPGLLDLQQSRGSRAPITAGPAGRVLPLQGVCARWRRRRQIDPMGFAGVARVSCAFTIPHGNGTDEARHVADWTRGLAGSENPAFPCNLSLHKA